MYEKNVSHVKHFLTILVFGRIDTKKTADHVDPLPSSFYSITSTLTFLI